MLALWLVLVACCLFQSSLPLALRVMLAIAVIIGGAFVLAGQLPGFTSRSLQRVVQYPEGEWTLIDSSGVEWAAALSSPARFMRRCAVLQWKSPKGRRWSFMTDSACGRVSFRRLRVRLRFS